jgi:tRNA G37 N-methylase Trm5
MKKLVFLSHSVAPLTSLLLFLSAATAMAQGQRKDPEYIAPNVYTPRIVVDHMLSLAEVKADDIVYDLGCGDGRIVILAARNYGARGVGVDIDQNEIKLAKENARAAGVEDRVEFIQQDLFETDLSQASVVMLYLGRRANAMLRPRLERYLQPGDRVVSHQFEIDGWHFTKRLTLRDENRIEHTIYLWVIGEHRIPARVIK